MEETLSRIVADLEDLHAPPAAPAAAASSSLLPQSPPMSESTLSDLHRLLVGADEGDSLAGRFFEELASRNLPLSSLAQRVGSAMDSGSSARLSLLASDVYLSLLLSPDAPVLSLFAPMSFVSLLRSVGKTVKSRQVILEDGSGSGARAPAKLKRKGGRHGRGSRNWRSIGNEDVEESEICAFVVLEKLKAPEKSELRALAVESIMEIFRALEYSDQVSFVQYVVKMTEGKGSFRLLAVDLIVPIVMTLKDPLGVQANEVNDSICKIMKEILGIGDGISQKTEATINNLLKIRCSDEKAAVRKAALHLVMKLTSFFSGSFDGVLLKTMGMACSDPLVSIRKAAVSALSEAFRKFPDGIVATEWLHSVPRLISDNESSIQEEYLAHNLLKRIEGFDMHPTEVNAHVKVLRTVCKQKASSAGEADSLILRWMAKLQSVIYPCLCRSLRKVILLLLGNNLVVMMADFCVRYTALIDCHITKITRCLGDPCELVRRQTFVLLSRLLQIRELADFLFGNILSVKAPLLAYNSFVEAIFVLNDCRVHGGHCSSQSSQSESRLFSIRGIDEISRSKRMRIYTCLLKQMAPSTCWPHLPRFVQRYLQRHLMVCSISKMLLDSQFYRMLFRFLLARRSASQQAGIPD
ncbi:hypothetical protein NL676_029587 [Syzygium grande]|nr:hypothetical protein NL676_029587 [Syzygium grande]